ncbi:unnamed protein product [Prunus armeniaca]|uniref:Uncharacterized protein n=1 Tax=Prunus armeniaca TaxID=36596 RepID=A0A6J5U1T2_PRUAR|nr:unnamed protein product [Prunus armeniaca]
MPVRAPRISIRMEIKFKFQKVMWLCTWGRSEESIKVSLKCLSCPAFQELIIESMSDVLDVKIEGPIMLSSCPTDRFDVLIRLHSWDIACMEV